MVRPRCCTLGRLAGGPARVADRDRARLPIAPPTALEDAAFRWRRPLLVLAGVPIRTKGYLHFSEFRARDLLRPEQLADFRTWVGPANRGGALAFRFEFRWQT